MSVSDHFENSDPKETDWELAKNFSSQVTPLPSSFTSVIRILYADYLKNNNKIGPSARSQAERLFRIPACAAMLYSAVKDLAAEKPPADRRWTVGLLIDSFTALDLAGLTTGFVYYKKCRSLIGEDQWEMFGDHFRKQSLIAAHLGGALPQIGIGPAILIGSMRYFGLAAICHTDKKAFNRYRRETKISKSDFDAKQERKLFGCSATEISVFLLSAAGIGVEVCDGYRGAFDDCDSLSVGSEDMAHRMRIGHVWIDALCKGLKQPKGAIPGHYYPQEEIQDNLMAHVERVSNGSAHWYDKTKDDLSPQNAPECFRRTSGAPSEPNEEPIEDATDGPDEGL